jgi:hypothetical protein
VNEMKKSKLVVPKAAASFERYAAGKTLPGTHPRTSYTAWKARSDRRDPFDLLLAQSSLQWTPNSRSTLFILGASFLLGCLKHRVQNRVSQVGLLLLTTVAY